MVLAFSFLGVGVSAGLFAAATRDVSAPPSLQPDDRLLKIPSEFFVDDRAPRSRPPQVPIEVLLLQIERHVRLEQAAAESFHDAPTIEALRATTTSPLVH